MHKSEHSSVSVRRPKFDSDRAAATNLGLRRPRTHGYSQRRWGDDTAWRVSFELVQKDLMVGVVMVAAVGASSSLSLDTARRFGMTLVSPDAAPPCCSHIEKFEIRHRFVREPVICSLETARTKTGTAKLVAAKKIDERL
jgi:hypothetical protein